MARVTFKLPIAPFSVNRMYYRDRRHKTQDYRDWELSVLHSMQAKPVQLALQKIRDNFDEKRHGLVVRFVAHYPSSVLYNKQGTISSRAEDLSNWEKPLLDLLFLPKVHIQPFPSGSPNVNCDDKYVLRLSSEKKAANDASHYIVVSIAIVTLPTAVAGP